MQLTKNSETEHTNQLMENQQYSEDEISKLRRLKLEAIKNDRNPSKSGFLSNPVKKERKKQRKKELYNNKLNDFNTPIIQNTSYSSFPELLKFTSEKPDDVGETKKSILNKEKTNKLSPEQKRILLSGTMDYYRKKKPKITNIVVTKNIQRMFNLWNILADEIKVIVPINQKRPDTKVFQETCNLCHAFLNDKLKKHDSVVLPKYYNFGLLPSKKYTPKDFEQYLNWFKLYLTDSSYKSFSIGKINLHLFLSGNKFSGTSSLLLTNCLTEPKRIVTFDYEEYFPILVDGWEQAGGCNDFTTKDFKNFDSYFHWALPHFKKLKNNFTSLNSFEDELDVLEFFTFGVLRQFTDRGKKFTTYILNQEFFKNMIEELRKHHGYTV